MEEEDECNEDIFEQDFIKTINLKKVCQGFKPVKSFDKLKDNDPFKSLFSNIGNDIDLEGNVEMDDEEFATAFTRDIFLMTQWCEAMEKNGKPKKYIDALIDKLAYFYMTLQRYTGGFLHDLDSSNVIEVFEVWIIKEDLTPAHIDTYILTLKRFYDSLKKEGVKDIQYELLDEEEINDLKRVAREFKTGAWDGEGEDYRDWRQRNIHYYM